MKTVDPKHLGTPNIAVAGLRLWIQGRQFPDIHDYWDGNWLLVLAECKSLASQVWAQGPILHLSELVHWSAALENLSATVEGEAELACMEPNLRAKVSLDRLGRGELAVNIAQDHLREQHTFKFDFDQSYLSGLIRQLGHVLAEYPIRGDEGKT
jgi:hypothetical protein